MTAGQRRAAADEVAQRYGLSQRRLAKLLGCSRSTLRYRRRPRPAEDALISAIRSLASRHPRWGYKKIHALLVRDGWTVNVKRVRRLWNELGLRRAFRRRKSGKRIAKPGSSENGCVRQPARFKNDVWTCDFVADRTADGRSLKWLTLVDEHTRECLVLHVDRKLTGLDVRRLLSQTAAWRGVPTRIRSDNGSEFVCEALARWLPWVGAKAIPVAPGHPWENGFIESFHSRLRDEFLECEEFESVADARAKAQAWRQEYNAIRPHASLNYRTPQEFAATCRRGPSDPTTADETKAG